MKPKPFVPKVQSSAEENERGRKFQEQLDRMVVKNLNRAEEEFKESKPKPKP